MRWERGSRLCPHRRSRPSRSCLAEGGWLNFRSITDRILSLGKCVQHMVSIRNGENSKLLSWSYRMSLGQVLEVWHGAFSVSWGSDPISCSGSPSSCLLCVVRLWSPVVVREVCSPAPEGRVGCREPGEHPGWGSLPVSVAYFVQSTEEGICLSLPGLHNAPTGVIRVLLLVNFREIKRVKVKVFEEVVKKCS